MVLVATKSYITFENQGYWISGTRISLDSIIHAFQQGLSPESITQNYPLLTLEQVYGALTFYLANRADLEAYLQAEEKQFVQMPQPLQTDAPDLYAKLQAAKGQVV
ncbi:MAG: DUF433 domain-containing protein [Prochlorothrix sp.]